MKSFIAKFTSRLLLWFIRLYQVSLSQLLGGHCKFVPTCSEYAKMAIVRFGPIKGVQMAVWRIVRCNPWSKGGYDEPYVY